MINTIKIKNHIYKIDELDKKIKEKKIYNNNLIEIYKIEKNEKIKKQLLEIIKNNFYLLDRKVFFDILDENKKTKFYYKWFSTSKDNKETIIEFLNKIYNKTYYNKEKELAEFFASLSYINEKEIKDLCKKISNKIDSNKVIKIYNDFLIFNNNLKNNDKNNIKYFTKDLKKNINIKINNLKKNFIFNEKDEKELKNKSNEYMKKCIIFFNKYKKYNIISKRVIDKRTEAEFFSNLIAGWLMEDLLLYETKEKINIKLNGNDKYRNFNNSVSTQCDFLVNDYIGVEYQTSSGNKLLLKEDKLKGLKNQKNNSNKIYLLNKIKNGYFFIEIDDLEKLIIDNNIQKDCNYFKSGKNKKCVYIINNTFLEKYFFYDIDIICNNLNNINNNFNNNINNNFNNNIKNNIN